MLGPITDLTSLANALGAWMLGGIRVELTRYILGAGGVALFVWAAGRMIAHRRIQTRRASRADIWREVRQSLWTIGVFAVVDLLTLALMMAGVITMARGTPPLMTVAWQVIALILMHDTWFYWAHRAMHSKALFRFAHMTHHLSRTPTPFAAYSFATPEAVIEALVIPVMFLIIGRIAPVAPAAALIFLAHQIARNALGHMGHELAWSGFTRNRWTGWLTTTTHHDLHHSEGRTNYGLYFAWWDRAMGTEHPRYHDRFEAVVTRPREQGQATHGLSLTPSSD